MYSKSREECKKSPSTDKASMRSSTHLVLANELQVRAPPLPQQLLRVHQHKRHLGVALRTGIQQGWAVDWKATRCFRRTAFAHPPQSSAMTILVQAKPSPSLFTLLT